LVQQFPPEDAQCAKARELKQCLESGKVLWTYNWRDEGKLAASNELTAGKGFVLLRGLPADDPEMLRRMFWIIANQLGQPVMQNARGEILSEVFDRFAGQPRGVDTRGYESNDELRFHCDGGDCIGMSCLRQAPEGGVNGLVSLLSIYNEILASQPHFVEILQRGYPLYSRKEKGDVESTAKLGKVQERRIPVFAWQDGYMSAWLNIKLSELAAEVSGQSLSEAEKDALRCVEEIAERPELKLSFKQQPGDVLWINNTAVMHRRDKYIDAEDPAQRRLLYRMWINLHDAQSLIPEHAALRNGIRGPKPVIVGV
ncbi:MAG: TauD/TfdA family dioxygenase, partial [Pseudomonadota bacterium]